MVLDPTVKQDLLKQYEKLEREGEILPKDKLKQCYETFKNRFGPDALAKLDGENLLTLMHEHGTRDSLVYWLEFKSDDELPGKFGSIAGGSALKFGIYRRKESGEWTTGSPQSQEKISTEEAVAYARKHRDEFIKGCDLLEALPDNASDHDYAFLQAKMDEVAPSVSNTAWGHKYFCLLYPNKLDDFHNPDYQRFHLIKLLQIPPEGDGRYLCAGRYVAMAKELDMPMNHLTTILNHRDGSPYKYWRVGTSDGTRPRNRWELMRSGNVVAIGWPDLGDLSNISHDQESKDKIKKLLETHYPGVPQSVGRATKQVFNFVATMAEGDLVLAADGQSILGIARVTGEYLYDPSSDFPHRRPVEWLSFEEWKIDNREGLQTTVHQLGKYPENLIAAEARILGASPLPPPPPPPDFKLSGIPGRVQAILERKGQAIVYGPPGTGKTYWAERTALELAARHNFNNSYDSLVEEQKKQIISVQEETLSFVRICCFHATYGYEDFIEGYRPHTENNQMNFQLKDGIFKRLCKDATENPSKHYYLVIDEINRGDISRIFGELLMIMEKGKRGKSILLPISGTMFQVPENIFIIGTMNTADRSIALLDTALRRRFGFVELMPDSSVLGETVIQGIPLGLWLNSLNGRIREHVGRDARNLQVGHSYLMQDGVPVKTFQQLTAVIQNDIIPLLEEYCYEDYSILQKLLDPALIDAENMKVRRELFDGSHKDELVAALLAPNPEISASSQAVDSEKQAEEEPGDEEDEELEPNESE